MAITIDNRIGPVYNSDSAGDQALRLSRMGALVTQDAHGRFWEAASRGNLFSVANQTGVTTQAGLSATTPALTLYNPKGNDKNLVLVYAGVTFSVAFAAAAVVWLATNSNPSAADVTGTLVTANMNALAGNNKQPSAKVYTAATLPAAPVAQAVLGVGLTGAITTLPHMQAIGREFAGSVILAPGAALSIQTSTASGASATFCEYIWEEVAI